MILARSTPVSLPQPTLRGSTGIHAGARRNLIGLFALTIFVVPVVAGCVTGFIYNRLDWLAVWYVNGYVALDDAQERQLRSLVSSTLDWHRRTQLPRYVQFLDRLDRDTDGAIGVDLLRRRFDEMSAAWDDLLVDVTPGAAVLLRSLRPDQIHELFENIDEENQDLLKEYSGKTVEVRIQRRSKAAIRAIQRFTGALNDAQRDLVRSQLAGMHDLAPDWLERRRMWQAHLRTLLESPLQGMEFEASLHDLLLHPNQFDQPAYREKADENQQQVFRMLAALSETLTIEQREKFGGRMQEYIRTLKDLVQRS